MTATGGAEPAAAAAGVPLTAAPRHDGVDAVAAGVRRLAGALPGAGGTSDELAAIATRLQGLAEEIERLSPSVEQRLTDMWRGEGVPRHDPACGPHNPIAPPMTLHGQDDGSVRGEVVLGVAYQGPPSHVHGGISALLLDHALGVANHWGGQSGRTASLTLDYAQAVPLLRPVTITARQDAVEGRKIWASGEISVDGRAYVTARGLFVTPRS